MREILWCVNFFFPLTLCFLQISDPLKAVVQVANYSHSTRLLAATTLRNVLGTRNLSELLIEREAISHTMVSENCWLFLCENNRTRTSTKEKLFSQLFFSPTFSSPTCYSNCPWTRQRIHGAWKLKELKCEFDAVQAEPFVSVTFIVHLEISTNDAQALIYFTFPFLLSLFHSVRSKDVSLPQQLQRAMATEAEAAR